MPEQVSLLPESNQTQKQPGDAGYVPPAELAPLPSRGVLYPVDSALHGLECVEIKAMTTRDEDILTSRALLKQGKAIDALLQSCLLNKSFNSSFLLSGDRNAILVAIRITRLWS